MEQYIIIIIIIIVIVIVIVIVIIIIIIAANPLDWEAGVIISYNCNN